MKRSRFTARRVFRSFGFSPIDTPALVLDLDAFDRNLERMAAALRGTKVRLRAHAYAIGRSSTDVARDILDRRLRLEAD